MNPYWAEIAWAAAAAGIISILVAGCVKGCQECEQTNRYRLEQGYEQVVVDGRVLWQKRE